VPHQRTSLAWMSSAVKPDGADTAVLKSRHRAVCSPKEATVNEDPPQKMRKLIYRPSGSTSSTPLLQSGNLYFQQIHSILDPQSTDNIMDASNHTSIATRPPPGSEPIANRSVSDGARSVDSGVVLSNSMDQSDENDQVQTRHDLSKLFRLESRTIVCQYNYTVC
jgi:hypothetical protein